MTGQAAAGGSTQPRARYWAEQQAKEPWMELVAGAAPVAAVWAVILVVVVAEVVVGV